MTDCLEQQGMERVVQQYLGSKGTDLDLKQQFTLYEVSGAPVGSSHTPYPVAAGKVGVWGGRGAVPGAMPPGLSAECSQAGG